MPVRAAKLSSTIVSGFVIDPAFITTIVESPPAAGSALVWPASSAEGRQPVAETTPAAAVAASTAPAITVRVVNDVRWILLNRLTRTYRDRGRSATCRTPPASIPRICYTTTMPWLEHGEHLLRGAGPLR